MPSYGVGSWRMVSAQSIPQYGVRDRLELVQATATVSQRPLAQPRAVGVAASRLDGASLSVRRIGGCGNRAPLAPQSSCHGTDLFPIADRDCVPGPQDAPRTRVI